MKKKLSKICLNEKENQKCIEKNDLDITEFNLTENFPFFKDLIKMPQSKTSYEV